MPNKFEEKKLIVAIDVTAKCNLACPSCVQGNMQLHSYTNVHIDPSLYERLVQRIHLQMVENDFNRLVIWLYNWTEPLLHPQLYEIISISKKYANYVAISSNFNFGSENRKVIQRMLDAEPSAIKVSVSGFSQGVHQIDHAKGNIEHVKENISWAADYIKQNNLGIRKFEVGYHLYNYNLRDEVVQMREFCMEHNVDFRPYLAYLSPLEHTFDSISGRPSMIVDEVQKRLLITPVDIYNRLIAQADVWKCSLRDAMVVFDVDLHAQLCCRTYDQILKSNIMEHSLADMFREKQTSGFCKKCISYKQNQIENPIISKHMETITREALER